jgi:hypothetical protein
VSAGQGVHAPLAPVAFLNVPGAQAEQLPVPVADLYVPARHAEHATPSDAAVYPSVHTQSVSSSLRAAELVFAGHAKQLPVPFADLNVPAPQTEHATPSDAAVYPSLHTQSVSSSLRAADLVFAGHASKYMPPGHQLPVLHGQHQSNPGSSPQDPGLHTQSVKALLPAAEVVR